jgi:hypothetical protein
MCSRSNIKSFNTAKEEGKQMRQLQEAANG